MCILNLHPFFQLKLDVSNADDSNISDSRCGSFVMYNCARLATLFSHFQQSVDEGKYVRN